MTVERINSNAQEGISQDCPKISLAKKTQFFSSQNFFKGAKGLKEAETIQFFLLLFFCTGLKDVQHRMRAL